MSVLYLQFCLSWGCECSRQIRACQGRVGTGWPQSHVSAELVFDIDHIKDRQIVTCICFAGFPLKHRSRETCLEVIYIGTQDVPHLEMGIKTTNMFAGKPVFGVVDDEGQGRGGMPRHHEKGMCFALGLCCLNLPQGSLRVDQNNTRYVFWLRCLLECEWQGGRPSALSLIFTLRKAPELKHAPCVFRTSSQATLRNMETAQVV